MYNVGTVSFETEVTACAQRWEEHSEEERRELRDRSTDHLGGADDVTKEALQELRLLRLVIQRSVQFFHQLLVLHESLTLTDVPVVAVLTFVISFTATRKKG